MLFKLVLADICVCVNSAKQTNKTSEEVEINQTTQHKKTR